MVLPYYYPATAMAASAFRLLEEDERLSIEEKEELQNLEIKSRLKLLLLLQEDEMFSMVRNGIPQRPPK